MSYQNYKSVMDINNQTRLNDDACERSFKVRNNSNIYDYNRMSSSENNRDAYISASNQVGIYQNNNGDGRGVFVDNDSSLKNGRNGNIMTSGKDLKNKNLSTRVFIGSPFMGSGQTVLSNPDLKSKLLYGEITNHGKSNNSLSGISINRFTPLIPSLEFNVQNTDHIIPSYWVRGGLPTRNNVKNIDYIRSCGIKK